MESPPILTVGYGQRSLAELIALIKQHAVHFLIDVRSNPVSRFQPEFAREELEAGLRAAEIRYVFMGDALGGRPADASCYTDGHVIYETVREREFFKAGITRLQNAVRGGYRVCLLCAERKPEECHRSKLVGVALHQCGLQILHLDSDGETVSQDEVMARLEGPQGELFDQRLRSRKAYRAVAQHGSASDVP